MKTIEITVDPQGQTKIQTQGFTGSSCREASKFLETALGQKTAERLTAEFFQNQSAQQRAQTNS